MKNSNNKNIINLAGMIDHSLLKPDATTKEIIHLCREAKKYKFATVFVNPCYVKRCVQELHGRIKVGTTVGFPLGATTTAVKKFETEQSLQAGAQEIDMVINIGMLKSGNIKYVENDIRSVVSTAHKYNAIVKVIIETALLNKNEKIIACQIAKRAGADFVKTSTGFSKSGATTSDVALMRKIVGPDVGIKASGGIRTKKDAIALIKSGATRIGTSSGVKIVEKRIKNKSSRKSK